MEEKTNNKIEKLYKSSEVAKMLGITTATLKNHYKAGLIEAVVINTHRYYTMESIQNYINAGRTKGKISK